MLRQPSLWFCQGAGACVGSPAQALPSASSSSTQLSMSFGSCTTSARLNTPQALSPAPENAPGGGRLGFAEPRALQSQRLPTANAFAPGWPTPVSFAKPSSGGGPPGVGELLGVDVAPPTTPVDVAVAVRVAVLTGVFVAVFTAVAV